MLCITPIMAYAQTPDAASSNETQENSTKVEKVIVHFWMLNSEGQWVRAQGDWIAVNGGSKKMSYYNTPAQNNSPIFIENATYTFDNSWVDDFGNTYPAEDIRLQGSDFIALFNGYEDSVVELNIYAQYTVAQDYYFYGTWIDNVANGGGAESHIVNANTGYTHTFTTPADIPDKYSFLYWDGGEYGQFDDGSSFEISAGNLGSDLYIDFIATYTYTPTSLVQVVYKTTEGIVYQTQPSSEPINIRKNAPVLENGQWLFNECPCVGEIALPDVVEPIITTEPINDEPIIKTVTVYGVLNGINGKDGVDGKDGHDGIDGRDGVDGKDGINGADGKNGTDGVNGKDGANGIDGKDGIDGINGINGRDGTDGKDGEQGPQGNPGKDGTDGVQGERGIAGINGIDGTTTIRYVSTPSISPISVPNTLTTSAITTTTPMTKSNILPTTETINDEQVALSSGLKDITGWGLLNLIFMLISILATFIPIIFRKKNTENYNKIIIALFAIAAIIVFVLTENILLPMMFVDHWTWLMGIICIISIILVVFSYFTKKETTQE